MHEGENIYIYDRTKIDASTRETLKRNAVLETLDINGQCARVEQIWSSLWYTLES